MLDLEWNNMKTPTIVVWRIDDMRTDEGERGGAHCNPRVTVHSSLELDMIAF